MASVIENFEGSELTRGFVSPGIAGQSNSEKAALIEAFGSSLFGAPSGLAATMRAARTAGAAVDEPAVRTAALSFEPAAPLPVFNNSEIASYLQSGFWDGVNRMWNMGSSGTAPQSGVLTYNIDSLSTAREVLAREALALYGMVLGISFVQVSGAADITFTDQESEDGAFTDPRLTGNIFTSVTVNIPASWDHGNTAVGEFVFPQPGREHPR